MLIAAQNRTPGCDEEGLWTWTSDLVIDLGGGSPLSPMMQMSPVIEVCPNPRCCCRAVHCSAKEDLYPGPTPP